MESILEQSRRLWIGRVVKLTDVHNNKRDALICQVWNVDNDGNPTYINVVTISNDENANDQYGRQIDRSYTSVVQKSDAVSAGRYFELV